VLERSVGQENLPIKIENLILLQNFCIVPLKRSPLCPSIRSSDDPMLALDDRDQQRPNLISAINATRFSDDLSDDIFPFTSSLSRKSLDFLPFSDLIVCRMPFFMSIQASVISIMAPGFLAGGLLVVDPFDVVRFTCDLFCVNRRLSPDPPRHLY
jgi:hypothetical protein